MGLGLGTSMWSGVSGLLAHSQRMSTIGNNLANVNTIGFKGARMDFMDLMSQDVGTAAGIGQVGRGVRVGAIFSDFSQGGTQTTSEPLDMAIGGNGFFMVKQKSQIGSNGQMLNTGNLTTYYTRAGNFRFDSDGYLVNPQGLAVQGWQVDQQRVLDAKSSGTSLTQVPIKGDIQDIRLDQFSIPAQATTNMTLITQLDSQESDHTTNATDPFFAMAEAWNGQASNGASPLSSSAYAYQTTMKVYDENGSPHIVTVYYDKVTVSNAGGKEYWEYIVTCNPKEDGRVLGGTAMKNTSNAGLLMIGTMTFDPSGNLENMSAFTLNSNAAPSGLSSWTSAPVKNGYPAFTANFKGVSNASTPLSANATTIGFNIGIRDANGFVGGAANAGAVGRNQTNLPGFSPSTLTINNNVTTNSATSSTTIFNSQDGYPAGLLSSVSVDENGILTGTFSNGQTKQLWALALTDFTNPWGLRREGGNLFSATLESGQGTTSRANSGRVGTVSGNTLEQSNVDMASEMVDMILTQRGFEANSKTITTVDSMLSEIIQLKR